MRAMQLHAVLQQARDLIMVLPGGDLQGCHVRAALEEACAGANLSTSELALSFCALVDAHSVVGRAVAGSYTTDLDQALTQRNRLLAARLQGWQRLRAEWIEVMQAPVQARKSRVWGRARPQARSLDEATSLADAAWREHLSKHHLQQEAKAKQSWQKLERSLSKSVAAVAAALASEDAAHKRETQHAHQQKRALQSRVMHESDKVRRRRWLWI